MRSNNNYNRV